MYWIDIVKRYFEVHLSILSEMLKSDVTGGFPFVAYPHILEGGYVHV